MKRIRRPRSEYEALLARKEAEGISYKQLAAETGIPESTLVLWLTRLVAAPVVRTQGCLVDG